MGIDRQTMTIGTEKLSLFHPHGIDHVLFKTYLDFPLKKVVLEKNKLFHVFLCRIRQPVFGQKLIFTQNIFFFKIHYHLFKLT